MSSWNQVETVRDEDGHEHAVYTLVMHDPDEVVSSWYTRARVDGSCPVCRTGHCVQRVLAHPDWDSDVVVHDCASELN
jgi:hypothetical protein